MALPLASRRSSPWLSLGATCGLWLGLVSGCGDRSDDTPAETDAGTDVDTETGETGGETGGPIDCAQYYDEPSCLAAGCAGMVSATALNGQSCDATAAVPFCVPMGGTPEPARSYFRSRLGQNFFISMPSCAAAVDEFGSIAPGEGWTECTGAASDPAGCDCFCQGGTCPELSARDEQLACDAEDLCEVLDFEGFGSSAFSQTGQCFVDAIKARTPGRLRSIHDYGEPDYQIDLWISASGDLRLSDFQDRDCSFCCPFTDGVRLCQPLADEALDACAAAFFNADPSLACTYSLGQFMAGCTAAEAACG